MSADSADSKEYWIGRWERGETGWHQAKAEPELVARFSDLAPTRVLVPLCGKSLDLTWLASRGHEVIGIEVSSLACQAFFEESGIAFQRTVKGNFTVFRGGKVTILNGDFFDLTAGDLPELGAVYDRAALIALPPELRKRYAAHLTALLRARSSRNGLRYLQVVLERTPHDGNGPPFSVPLAELEALYGADFEISLFGREKVEQGKSVAGAGLVEQCVYGMRPRW